MQPPLVWTAMRSPTVVNIEVGQTVCWSWTDASMLHNVKQVDGFKSTTYVEGGVTQASSLNRGVLLHLYRRHHLLLRLRATHWLDMFGEIVVGDGGSTSSAEETTDSSEDTRLHGRFSGHCGHRCVGADGPERSQRSLIGLVTFGPRGLRWSRKTLDRVREVANR